MTRALFKMGRGGAKGPITIQSSTLGVTYSNSTPYTAHTFAAQPIGSGTGRTMLLMVSAEDGNALATGFSSVTVGGVSMISRASNTFSPLRTGLQAILTLALSASGNQDIIVTTDSSVGSTAISFLILEGVTSAVPRDIAVGNYSVSGTSIPTTSTLLGLTGGIVVGLGLLTASTRSIAWGSILTLRNGVQTGTSNRDHQHSVAYDLLATDRVASTETATASIAVAHRSILTASFK